MQSTIQQTLTRRGSIFWFHFFMYVHVFPSLNVFSGLQPLPCSHVVQKSNAVLLYHMVQWTLGIGAPLGGKVGLSYCTTWYRMDTCPCWWYSGIIPGVLHVEYRTVVQTKFLLDIMQHHQTTIKVNNTGTVLGHPLVSQVLL